MSDAPDADTRDPILASERPQAASAILMQLSWIRSAYIVGRALWALYPTEPDWERGMQDPELLEEIAAFSGVLDDIRRLAETSGAHDMLALQRSWQQHGGRALEALSLTAERLIVDPADLVSVLLHA